MSFFTRRQQPLRQGYTIIPRVFSKNSLAKNVHCIDTFPNKPWFSCAFSTSLLKTLWEKEKLLVTSNFSFSQCFPAFWTTFRHFRQTKNCRLQTLSVWRNPKSVVWERVMVWKQRSLNEWLIDCMMLNAVFNSISVISGRPVHLAMLSWSSVSQYSTQYSFQATGCFPT